MCQTNWQKSGRLTVTIHKSYHFSTPSVRFYHPEPYSTSDPKEQYWEDAITSIIAIQQATHDFWKELGNSFRIIAKS
ncbi:hypothetical protein KJ652_04350 [Patescibacteria group bacterium]|nr:hypothetical protein [Patescibacteria group bacterium]MBU1911400.1 hypothetical protein [Patescibacteria group bacterium]